MPLILARREECAPTSSTTLASPAEVGFQVDILVEIHSQTGKNITRMSAMPEQQEVLFRAGTTFRVLDSGPTDDGKIKAYWEEIEP